MDAGIEDLTHEGDTWRLTTEPTDLPAVRSAIAEAALGRMTPGPITCSLVPTDAVLAATGLDLVEVGARRDP